MYFFPFLLTYFSSSSFLFFALAKHHLRRALSAYYSVLLRIFSSSESISFSAQQQYQNLAIRLPENALAYEGTSRASAVYL